MNTIEMMIEVFENRNKVKHKNWTDKQYLHEKDGILHFNNGISDSPFPIKSMHGNWELYMEDNRKDLPEGIKHITKLHELVTSHEFKYCGNLTCNKCPMNGNIVESECSIVLIRDMVEELNKEYKLREE